MQEERLKKTLEDSFDKRKPYLLNWSRAPRACPIFHPSPICFPSPCLHPPEEALHEYHLVAALLILSPCDAIFRLGFHPIAIQETSCQGKQENVVKAGSVNDSVVLAVASSVCILGNNVSSSIQWSVSDFEGESL